MMNKKILFTSICVILGSLVLTETVFAKPNNNANKQSIKKCPQSYLKDPSAVRLTKTFPNAHFNDNGTLDDTDDFYELCSGFDGSNFTGCDPLSAVPVASGSGLIIIGTNRSNIIEGTPGDDIICGLNGNDDIDGGPGVDEIHGNNGSDRLSGGLGDDVIYGGNGQDELWGYDEDNDDLSAEVLEPGDTDDDVLEGGNGKDNLNGGPGSDELYGGNSPDQLNGGLDDDLIDGGRSNDVCLDDGDGVNDDDCDASEAEEND